MALFSRKKTRSSPPKPPPPGPSEELERLADLALDATADLVRAYGEKAFDLERDDAQETREACERWARHVLVGTPAHEEHERVALREDPAGPGDVAAGDAAPEASPATRRDFPKLVRFVSEHRGREHAYVTQTLSDLRLAIWSMVQAVRGGTSADRRADALAGEHLKRLAAAMEDPRGDRLRREARECIRVVGEILQKRDARQRRQIASLAERLAEMRADLERAWEQTGRDPLTGLGDRAAFEEHAERIADVGFLFAEPAYLFLIDVDHFKWVNETYGESGGDEVLRQIGRALAGCFLRRHDLASRLDGGEFAVLLRLDSDAFAERLAERALYAVRDLEVECGGDPVRVTVSVGAARLEPSEETGTWIERARAALSSAKQGGRDRLVVAPRPSGERVPTRLAGRSRRG